MDTVMGFMDMGMVYMEVDLRMDTVYLEVVSPMDMVYMEVVSPMDKVHMEVLQMGMLVSAVMDTFTR